MEHRISRIDPLQAGKVGAALYFIVGLVTMPFALAGMLGTPSGLILVVLLPLIYALLGFIFIPIVCWLYNHIANRIGGIEITLVDTSGQQEQQF